MMAITYARPYEDDRRDTFNFDYQPEENLTAEISVAENATGTLYFYALGQGNPALGGPGGYAQVDPGETKRFTLADIGNASAGGYNLTVYATDTTSQDPPEPNTGAYTLTIESTTGAEQTSTQTETTTTETTTAEPITETPETQTETTTTENQTDGGSEMGNRSAEDILQAAQQSHADIEDFNATLVSSSTISNESGVVQTSNTTGKLSVKQPDKIRLEILTPETRAGSIVVSNGTTTVIYDAANNTVSSFNLSDFSGLTAANQTGYLDGIEQSLSQADVSYEGTATVAGQETYVLSAMPNASVGNLTGNQTYYLSQESYIPVKTVTEGSFSFGNETTTTTSTTILRNLQVNVGLSDSVFNFEAPENATRTGGFTSNVSTYDSVEAAQANTDIAVCEPSEIPDGYSFANATVTTTNDNTSVTLHYTNGSADPTNGSLSVRISTAQPTQQANETSLGENVSVNGQSGMYIGANGQGFLSFTNDGLQYTITGSFSQDELVSIGESIDCATDDTDASDQDASDSTDIGQNDEDDDGDGHVDEDGEDDNDSPSNDDDDGDGAIDEDDESDDGDDGSDDFNGNAEDDDDGDGHFDEDDENDGGNSDDVDNDGDGAVDEDDEPDTDD